MTTARPTRASHGPTTPSCAPPSRIASAPWSWLGTLTVCTVRRGSFEDFIDLLDAVRGKVVTVQAATWDLSTASGRAVARTLAAWARYESEHKSDRVRRKLKQNAEQGKPHGGTPRKEGGLGRRPFGYGADCVTIDAAEATVIREAAARIIGGETLRSVTAWLNTSAVPTVTGRTWITPTVRGILTNPRYAGLRATGRGVHARIVGKAIWDPILDRATFEQVRAILTDPARRTNRSARTYLLSGLVRCGRCDAVMGAKPRRDGPGVTVRTYCCVSGPGRGACGRMRIPLPLPGPRGRAEDADGNALG